MQQPLDSLPMELPLGYPTHFHPESRLKVTPNSCFKEKKRRSKKKKKPNTWENTPFPAKWPLTNWKSRNSTQSPSMQWHKSLPAWIKVHLFVNISPVVPSGFLGHLWTCLSQAPRHASCCGSAHTAWCCGYRRGVTPTGLAAFPTSLVKFLDG